MGNETARRGRSPGRPPKQPEDRRSVLVRFVVTPEEHRIIQEGTEAARADTVSVFIRQSALAAAEAAREGKQDRIGPSVTRT